MKLLLAILLYAPLLQAQQPAPAPDTIYFHGNILTGKGLEPIGNSPQAEHVTALAILAGSIVATGDDARILSLKGPATELVDLHGAFVMPGFNDAHVHLAFGGQHRLAIDLDNVASLDEMLSRIKAYAATLSPGQWIVGGGWDQTKWASGKLPTRQDIDAVTAGHPALISRTDLHIAVANSAALAAAGITGTTVAPSGSKIELNASGQPSGILREAPALALVQQQIPKPDATLRRRALEVSINDALAHGITSLQDFSDWDDFKVMETMEAEGKLPIRISEWLDFNLPVATLKQMQASHDIHDPMLHTAMLKGFMDGSLGSRTAALLAPYADDPANSGIARFDQKKLDAMTSERAEAGFQIGFHAIGDKANSMALDAFGVAEAARRQQLDKLLPQLESSSKAHIAVRDESRYRIEHAQVLAPADFDRLVKLGVVASMQPSHLLTDMAWAGDRLGPKRVQFAYAWRSMLDHRIPLAFGTDYPVETLSPFRGLYAAITRMNVEGTKTFQPQEKLTLPEALYAYTQGSAYAQFDEDRKGRLETGFFADFIVVNFDITKATPQELLHTQVLRTVVGGVTRYTANRILTEDKSRSVPDGD